MTPAGSVPGRAATYLATQPRHKSSSRRGGHKAGPRALTCLAFSSGSAVPLSITRSSCPSVTLRQLCLLCNPSLLAYRPANVAKKGTGKKKKKKTSFKGSHLLLHLFKHTRHPKDIFSKYAMGICRPVYGTLRDSGSPDPF